MSEYDDCSREELIEQIERLKRENAALSSGQKASRGGARRMLADSPGGFRDKYAAQILESLPDMLTVLDHSGQLVDLVSSEETNHVGAPSDSLIGRDICTLLSPEAYHNVKENLDYVVRNKIGSTSHHDITLDNHTRHYENRIFPLDDEHALCMCRDVTDQVIVQQELEQANLRMVAAEDIALLSHWYYYEDIKEFEAPKIIPWLVGGGDGKLKRCRKELFLSHVHPADRDALLNQLRYGQAGDGYVEYRISVQGQTRYYHSRILRIIRKEDGSRIIEGYAQDMTYVVKRLHDFEAVKYALNNAVEEIYSCDLEGTLEFANPTTSAGIFPIISSMSWRVRRVFCSNRPRIFTASGRKRCRRYVRTTGRTVIRPNPKIPVPAGSRRRRWSFMWYTTMPRSMKCCGSSRGMSRPVSNTRTGCANSTT